MQIGSFFFAVSATFLSMELPKVSEKVKTGLLRWVRLQITGRVSVTVPQISPCSSQDERPGTPGQRH